MLGDENPIQHYVTFERTKAITEKELAEDLNIIMKNESLRPYVSSYEESYINDSNSWRYSNIENLKRDELLRNAAEILRRAFIIGGIILVLFFALFSLSNYILTSIYMRKRELAVFQSLGMDYQGLKKMLLYENAMLILTAIISGSLLALVILQNQFEEIRMGAATVEMHFPIVAYSVVIIGVLILTSAVSVVAVRKVKNINVIETLRR
jgi:ABC-type antimicrobial peptide transport system permease subunit